MKYEFENIIETEAATIEEARRKVAKTWLGRQLEDRPPTQEEIDTLVAELETRDREEARVSDFVQRAVDEIAWIDNTLATIDDMTAAQLRDVVKRLLRENRELILVIKKKTPTKSKD